MRFSFTLSNEILRKVLPFLEWWVGELRQILHPALRFFEEEKSLALLQLNEECVEVCLSTTSGKEIQRDSFPKSFSNLNAEEVAKIRQMVERAQVALSLPTNEICLIECAHLGAKAPTEESVKYRLLQESPIDVQQVAFSWRSRVDEVAGGFSGTKLEIALCRKLVLGRTLEAAGHYGLVVSAVGYAIPGCKSLEWMFPIPRAGGIAFSFNEYKNRLLIIGLLVWPILAMTLAGLVSAIQLRAIQSDLNIQRSMLKSSETLLHRRAELVAVHGALEQAVALPGVVNVLDELGRLLPSSAWMTEIRIEGRSMHLIGFSEDTTAAVKALAASKQIRDPRLGSVSSPNAGISMSQFELTATLEKKR